MAGGLLYTYAAGTTTPLATYSDAAGVVPNANPVVLDSTGSATVRLGTVSYKFVLKDASSTTQWTADNYDPAPYLTAIANPATGFGADLVANAVRSYDIFSSLRAANIPNLAAGQTLVVDVQGGSAVGDNLAGIFYWSASSTATDDSLNVIKPTAAGSTGRYLRQSGLVNGTFTATLTGMTGSVTFTATYYVSGNIASISCSNRSLDKTGTSNTTSMTLTGLPTVIRPSTLSTTGFCGNVIDAGATKSAQVTYSGAGVLSFALGFDGTTAFTNSGTKGLTRNWNIIYPLD